MAIQKRTCQTARDFSVWIRVCSQPSCIRVASLRFHVLLFLFFTSLYCLLPYICRAKQEKLNKDDTTTTIHRHVASVGRRKGTRRLLNGMGYKSAAVNTMCRHFLAGGTE